jgi:protein-disulfide isomerase
LAARPPRWAHCAHLRGKFLEIHDAIFGIEDLTPEALDALPDKLGLASAAFSAYMEDEETLKAVRDDIEEGKSLGVAGTPSLFVNGRHSPNYWVDVLESIIDHILAPDSR